MDFSPRGSSVHGDSPGKKIWSELPCPPPGIEARSTTLQVDSLPFSLSHQGNPRILEWIAYPFSKGISNPEIKLGSLALQADSLPAELPGKPHRYTTTCKIDS